MTMTNLLKSDLGPPGTPLLDLDRRPDAITVLLVLGGLIAGGLGFGIVFWNLFQYGHAAFNTSSDMAWGAPIAFYLFFLLASSGLSIIASLDTVFGVRLFWPVAKRCVWMSIVALVAGFAILALEIGRPFRMLWALPLAFQIRSPMWWMGVFYSLDLLLLCVKFWLLHRGDWKSRLSRLVAIVSFVVCILAPGTLGLVFGMMAMRPAWFSPIMPMYFILTGFASAVAFLILFTSVLPRQERPEGLALNNAILPRLFFVTLLTVIGMRFGQVVTGLWSNYEGMEAHWRALTSLRFHIEIWIGFVLPAVIMSSNALRGSRALRAVSAILFLCGMFTARLELLIMGQEVPLFRGYWAGYVDYAPSFTEWMLGPFGVGIFLLLYGAGNWLLRLSDAESH